jgi:hypothetical protein
MELIIENEDKLDLKDFSQEVIKQMREYLESHIDEDKLIRWDEYLNKEIKWGWQYKVKIIRAKTLLLGAVYNLQIIERANKITIRVNPNAIINETKRKYIDILKLITYGNLSYMRIYDELLCK